MTEEQQPPGGQVHGSSAADDSIRVRLNTGCGYYPLTAEQLQAGQRWRALLDAINDGGTMPRFAAGGVV